MKKKRRIIEGMGKKPFLTTGIPVLILAAGFVLSKSGHLWAAIPELIGLTAVITLLIAVAVYASEKGWCRWSPAVIFLVAAVLRLMFLFRMPELSDDMFRYVFDGHMIMDGINPYAAPPLTASVSNPAAADLIPKINHAHLVTIYPPAAQLVFGCGAFFGSITGMKLVMIILDLISCGLGLGILRRLRLPEARLVLYAWHPLPFLEIGASGHIEAAAVCFLLLSVFLSLNREKKIPGRRITDAPQAIRPNPPIVFLAGACFAGAVLVKWIPLLFFPGVIWLVPAGKKNVWMAGAGLIGFLLCYPFWPQLKAGFETLAIYLANWEFSGFGFRILRRVTGDGDAARLILSMFFIACVGWIYASLFLRYMPKKPFFSLRPASPQPVRVIQACYAAAMAWLLTTPTLHPWYGLYLAFLLPFAGGPSGMVLSWSVFLSYRVLIFYHLNGQWTEDNLTPALIFAAPVVAHIVLKGIGRISNRHRECP